MRIPKTFAVSAGILTLLASALIALVATPFAPPRAKQAECQLPLHVTNPDGNYIVPNTLGAIVYKRVRGGGDGPGAGTTTTGTTSTGTASATDLLLDAYVQPGDADMRPGVIVVHGGGWERGSRAAFTGQFLEMLTREGYNWVAIDYRLGPLARHDQAVADVRAAVAFVRCHARALKIDPNRLVLFGEDTGAQLAALAASRPSSGISAMVLVGGVYDLLTLPSTPAGVPPGVLRRASPVHVVRRGMPATLLVHGTADTEVPLLQPKRYCEQLAAVRAPCTLLEVAGASHRAENWWPSQWGYKSRIADWLARTTRFDAPPPTAAAYVAPGAADRSPGAADRTTASAVSSAAAGLHKDIVFSPAHGLTLDVYIPSVQRGEKGPFPAVIIAHGGGWEAGDKVTYVTPLFEPLAKAGFAWFSIDYRLTPDVLHPAQLEDLRDAFRFVRANASRFDIDPDRIALLGESASGQMVMQAATDPAIAPAAVVSFYGVYDFEPMVESSPSPPRSLLWRLFRLPALDDHARAVLRAHSPIHHVRRGMPPVLLIHGTNEHLWAQGQSMARVLADRGIPHELIAIEGAPHGLENWEGHAPWMRYKPVLINWLRDNLGRAVPDRD